MAGNKSMDHSSPTLPHTHTNGATISSRANKLGQKGFPRFGLYVYAAPAATLVKNKQSEERICGL